MIIEILETRGYDVFGKFKDVVSDVKLLIKEFEETESELKPITLVRDLKLEKVNEDDFIEAKDLTKEKVLEWVNNNTDFISKVEKELLSVKEKQPKKIITLK